MTVDKIYMIAHINRDEYDRLCSTDSIDEDYGFYTTREAAQAKVDELHDFQKKYARYLVAIEDRIAKAQKEFEIKTRLHDELRAAGVEPGFFRPVKPQVSRPQTFEQYIEIVRQYTVVEVESAEHG